VAITRDDLDRVSRQISETHTDDPDPHLIPINLRSNCCGRRAFSTSYMRSSGELLLSCTNCGKLAYIIAVARKADHDDPAVPGGGGVLSGFGGMGPGPVGEG